VWRCTQPGRRTLSPLSTGWSRLLRLANGQACVKDLPDRHLAAIRADARIHLPARGEGAAGWSWMEAHSNPTRFVRLGSRAEVHATVIAGRVRRGRTDAVKTSMAEANGYRCPKCGDETTRDKAGRGFVRHKAIRDCPFERGERDLEAGPPRGPQP
jgi:predicted RNA-binding Zn-ribbon protein involved in translation (DUF1610 family)